MGRCLVLAGKNRMFCMSEDSIEALEYCEVFCGPFLKAR